MQTVLKKWNSKLDKFDFDKLVSIPVDLSKSTEFVKKLMLLRLLIPVIQ